MPVPLHWHTEPFLLISILGAAWCYAVGTGPLREKIAPEASYPWKYAVLFLASLLLTYLTVASPLDQIGEDFLFSLHMVQHMLLVYAIPPLIIWSLPGWLLDRGVFRWTVVVKIAHFLTHPVTAGLLFTGVYTVWHVPALYEAALQNKVIHIFEHWTMFITAILMWWPILSPSEKVPRISYGARMLYVSILMVGQFPVFGYLTFSGEVFYPTYEYAPRIFDISPLDDQIFFNVIYFYSMKFC